MKNITVKMHYLNSELVFFKLENKILERVYNKLIELHGEELTRNIFKMKCIAFLFDINVIKEKVRCIAVYDITDNLSFRNDIYFSYPLHMSKEIIINTVVTGVSEAIFNHINESRKDLIIKFFVDKLDSSLYGKEEIVKKVKI